VIARAHRRAANHQSTSETKDWVVVLVSAQVEPLRLLDGSENNPHQSWKQGAPRIRVLPRQCPGGGLRVPAHTVSGRHLGHRETVGGTVFEHLGRQIGSVGESYHRWSGT